MTVDIERNTVHANMVRLPGGVFTMGSDRHYPEEKPAHTVRVGAFWIDRHAVTNRQFAQFVAATGHVTLAEKPADPADYPGADPTLLLPSSVVLVPPTGAVDTGNIYNWWQYLAGADWRHPRGPGSSLEGLDDHPVVHVAFADALAYATWAGKELPSEAEWEYASKGGSDATEFPWGDELVPDGRFMANTWQGEFPWENQMLDGFEFTAPVGSFPAQRFRPLRHDRKRVGMDRRLVPGPRPHPEDLLHAGKPAWRRTRREHRPAGRRAHSASRHERWLARVRAQLLPSLPAGCAHGATRRHIDEPRRVSLHRAGVMPASDRAPVTGSPPRSVRAIYPVSPAAGTRRRGSTPGCSRPRRRTCSHSRGGRRWAGRSPRSPSTRTG